MNPWRRHGRPLAIAHRGHSIDAPENTMTAYHEAVELGAEMIEADVNITRDGRLAMIHDHDLGRTTSGAGPASAITWADLVELDAGSWFDARFAGTRVPSASALLDFARDAGVSLCLEVKGADSTEAWAIAAGLLELLVERNALEMCVMSGYDHAALRWAKSQVPELQLAPDRVPDDVAADPDEAFAQVERIGATIMQNHHAFLTQDLVASLHARDIAVWSWPTTDEASLTASIGLGADGVMGDDVRTMLAVLDRLCPASSLAAGHGPFAQALLSVYAQAMMRDG